MPLKVQDQSPQVAEMAQAWPICEALMGGTASMRAAGTSLLPKWPNEDQLAYDARKATATLYPAFKRTVGVMAGKPFSKQLTLSDDTPDQIKEYCEDVDLEGHNLHAFSVDVLMQVLAYGICGVLIDYPMTAGQVRTMADEKAIGARPYFVLIRHSQVLGWKSERRNGVLRLTQLRLAETAELPDGEFGTMTVNRVRVLSPGAWALYQEVKDSKEYVLIEGGTTTLSDIPYVPFYGARTGFMTASPPLMDLAYQNVEHWQSKSDQSTILHVARVPVLTIIGAEDEFKLTIGASSAVKLPMGADMRYVEHSGAAIDAGRLSLQDLESQMIQTGAELLVQKPSGQRTATQDNNEAEANKSDLQRIIESFEDSLDQCLAFLGAWVGIPESGNASLFKDFGSGSLSDASAQLILSMQQGGLLSKESALIEWKRRGILSPDMEPLDELEKVKEDGPALGSMEDPGGAPGNA